ncbi:MAG: CobW family GTP-binding protein [Faecalibacterium sp.]
MTKIDIFSGFLGAGKTTLIKKLIQESFAGQKLVLIENEFGEIGIDGGFLEESGIQINEMNSGCICCSLVGDFREALKKVVEEYAPDRILIEPSGVGKLSDVTRAVESVAGELDVVLNSFVTVADVGKVKLYMKNFGEFYNDQIEHASCVILSRTENVAEAKVATAVQMIREKNAKANIITTPWTVLEGAQIVAAMQQENDFAQELLALAQQANEHAHAHHHEHGEHEHHHEHGEGCGCGHHHGEHEHHHEHGEGCGCGHHHGEHEHHHEHGATCSCGHDHGAHDHHHADEVFTSWGTETAHKTTKEALETALSALDSGDYGMILRAKGIVDGGDAWYEFDYVPGEINLRPHKAEITGKLVVIGAQMDEAKVAALFGC